MKFVCSAILSGHFPRPRVHERARNDIAWRPILRLRLQTGVQIVIEWLTAGCQLQPPAYHADGRAVVVHDGNSADPVVEQQPCNVTRRLARPIEITAVDIASRARTSF